MTITLLTSHTTAPLQSKASKDLVCVYRSDHPYLAIAPVKQECLSADPPIYIYHELITVRQSNILLNIKTMKEVSCRFRTLDLNLNRAKLTSWPPLLARPDDAGRAARRGHRGAEPRRGPAAHLHGQAARGAARHQRELPETGQLGGKWPRTDRPASTTHLNSNWLFQIGGAELDQAKAPNVSVLLFLHSSRLGGEFVYPFLNLRVEPVERSCVVWSAFRAPASQLLNCPISFGTVAYATTGFNRE